MRPVRSPHEAFRRGRDERLRERHDIGVGEGHARSAIRRGEFGPSAPAAQQADEQLKPRRVDRATGVGPAHVIDHHLDREIREKLV
jgi:hypothetical protein